MAINAVVLDILAQLGRKLAAGTRPRILCLGYPDMLVSEAQLGSICGAEAARAIAYRDDSAEILRWHQLPGLARVAETRSVFSALGWDSEFVDIAATRGFEIVLDLNDPAPAQWLGRYDLVYDGGTMEHCFNVGQVMRNILAFARVGGFIVHVNPLNLYNHGFFNFSPTFYYDWYARGGNLLAMPICAMHGPVLESRLTRLEDTARIKAAPESSVLVVAALRKSEGIPPWPMQSKYVRNAELKG